MPAEQDRPDWLPEPPPPRPARREGAIESAMRRFDGVDEPAPSATPRPAGSWSSRHRPQLAFAMSAALVLVVGIPVALNGLREPPPASVEAPADVGPTARLEGAADEIAPPAQVATPDSQAPEAAAEVADAEQAPVGRIGVPSAAEAPPAPPAPAQMAAAAPPPPPPPPPAPQSPQFAERAEAAPAQDGKIVVTGARVASAAPVSDYAAGAEPAGRAATSPTVRYARFVPRLQAAVAAGDRRAVVGLVRFPLRVNSAGGSRLYRDRRSVEADYDRILHAARPASDPHAASRPLVGPRPGRDDRQRRNLAFRNVPQSRMPAHRAGPHSGGESLSLMPVAAGAVSRACGVRRGRPVRRPRRPPVCSCRDLRSG